MLRMRRGTRFLWRLFIAIAFSFVCPFVHAQYTGSFQTNIISGVTSNWLGNYVVGNTTFADALIIQGSGALADGFGYLGNSLTTSNNSALVTGSGSIWSNGLGLYVGNNNSFCNSLVISNGAHVLNGAYAYVGQGSVPKVTSNSVVVTGSGSVWSNGQFLSVGYPGACNGVTVNDGGLLIDSGALIGSYAAGSSSNSVVVSDAGSVWTNTGSGDLRIGDWSVVNSVTVSNGGKVFHGGSVYVGYEIGANSNSLVVTGRGSFWTNSVDLNIGLYGAGNALVILNSGSVWSSTGYIGNNGSAAGNSAVVNGTGSVWRVVNGLNVGNSGAGNSLVINNGGQVITHFNEYVGNGSSSSNNRVVITGAGSVWDNTDPFHGFAFYLGYSGAGNSLIISNGGKLLLNNGTIGANSSASNNSVVVTGSGSVWSNNSGMVLGYASSGNGLVISNGGRVFDTDAYVGHASYYSWSNQVVVSGTGSVWNSAGEVVIGSGGAGNNNLVIKDGGMVVDGEAFLYGNQNSVWVTGAGSVWSNQDGLLIGESGPANSLIISNGGAVIDADATVGYMYYSNIVRVVNGGTWLNNTLTVGYIGWSNSVVVDGGNVFAANVVVGPNPGTCEDYMQLNSGGLYVTNAADGGVLEVRNGAFIQNGGTLQVDTLVMTNACGLFARNGGTLLYGQLVLDPDLSAVGDGIPNGWKQQYGLDPLDPNLANKDVAGTGFTVLQDYLVGVDPTNPATAFRITSVTPLGNDLLVTWTMGPNRTNALQAAADDGSGGYSTNGFVDIFTVTNTVGTVTNYLDAGAATNMPSRYYRVRLVP
ncbi:MAG TPA: hypothetical protein VMP11_05275 [Verrucomicrobiae bacterium]|nr:hypothetical protein [Verrucomicrobiae bacterium]